MSQSSFAARFYQELALTEFAVVKGVIYSYCKQCQASMRKGYKLKKENKQPTHFDCRSCKQSKQLLDYNLVTRLGKQERDLICVECRTKQKRLLGVLVK